MDGVILPPSVVIATTNTSLLNTIRCLGTQENITVELFDFNGISQDLVTVSCSYSLFHWRISYSITLGNLHDRSKDTATHRQHL